MRQVLAVEQSLEVEQVSPHWAAFTTSLKGVGAMKPSFMHLCWQIPSMQSLQSPAVAQSLDEEHLSPQAIVTGSSVLTGSSFMHLCWQIPSMHNLQSPAVAQSELEEQASPQTAPKKGTS